MKIFQPLFLNVIKSLIRNNVNFLLIGGYAVNYYGYGRYTGDIDFWIRPTEANKLLFLNALRDLERSNDDILAISKLDFTLAQVLTIGIEPLRIDFLTKVNLVSFDEAWNKKVFMPLEDLQLPVIDYNHLILTKVSTGRTKDQLDLEELQKINQFKKNPF